MPQSSGGRLPPVLAAFALCSFAIGTTEFLSIGLLPQIATGLSVSIPAAGGLVSAYAVGVVVGAPALIALGTRLPRRTLMLALMAVFVAGNLAAAAAPSFGTLFAARFVTALPHGAVFGLSAVIAAQLVAPERRATAIAATFLGLTLSTCIGAPLGTLVGQQFGWRVAFLVVAGLGGLALLALLITMPALPRPAEVTLRREAQALILPRIVLLLAIATIGFGGVFAALGYLAPILEEDAGFSEASAVWGLAVFGVGLTVGNVLSPRLQRATGSRRESYVRIVQVLAVLVVVLVAFAASAHVPALAVLGIFAVGVVGFTLVPIVQGQLLEEASGAPTLTSAAMHSAFNAGNALGPLAGGVAIGAGLGNPSAPAAGALLSAVGLLVAYFGLVRRAAPAKVPA